MKENREELEARIAAYIDGQLPAADAARLEVFLANTDPALAQQVIGMIAERHAVRALPKPKAPDDLAARVMEQVERTSLLSDVEHFAAPRRPWWQSRAAVAAALILVLSGFTWFVLEAVRRPNSAWRDTVMDDSGRHDDASRHEVAMAPTAAPVIDVPSPAATAPTGIAFGTVAPPASSNLASAAGASSAPSAEAGPTIAGASATSQSHALTTQIPAQPVFLTFVARDSQDYTRLRSKLEEFLSNGREASRNQLALNNRDASDALRTSGKDVPTGQFQSNVNGGGGQGQTAQNAPAENLTTQNQSAQNLTQGNSNANEQFAARAATKAQPTMPPQEASSDSYQLYDQRQRAFTTPGANGVGGRSQNYAPLPYHVVLRPDQIQQLTHDFQIETPAPERRGVAGYREGLSLDSSAKTSESAAAHTASELSKDKSNDMWIDCIITMNPPVSPGMNAPTLLSPLPSPSPVSPPSASPGAPAQMPSTAASPSSQPR